MIRILMAMLIVAAPLAAQDKPAVQIEHGVMMPMRDGVRLATDVYRPTGAGKYPVILIRSPYGRKLGAVPEKFAGRGFAVVSQDVRGRYDSEGEWVPFFHEEKDGYDAVQWAATRPWSDGRVIMYGGSYVAMVQWLAAKSLNPHLKGLVTSVSPGDFYEDFFFEGGGFLLGAGAMWAAFTDGKVNNELDPLPWDRIFRTLPVTNALAAANRDPKFFREWASHPRNDAYWRAIRFHESFPSFDFPALHLGGWFDIFQKGTIENFRRMTTVAKSAARSRQEMIMGPWGHQGQNLSKVGEVDFGPGSSIDIHEVGLEWMERNFKGKAGRPSQPVRVFTMGENKWNEYSAWPVPGTRYVDYFLRGSGKANGAGGDGVLAVERPTPDESADRFEYDPTNPVPTRGGGNCCWPKLVPWGAMDQRSIEDRSDVLIYTTPPLTEDLRVTGPVSLTLWVSSTAPTTDFTGKLVDVAPDGFAMNLTDGLQRVVGHRIDVRPAPLGPTEVVVDLWNTSHLFQRGHRIRLEVSSSNFPRFSRNLNLPVQQELGEKTATASQTVYHDATRPSRLVLPVLR